MPRIQCPYCGSSPVIPIVYGYPSFQLFQQAEEGKVKLGGCEVREDNPKKFCASCERTFDTVRLTFVQVHRLHFFIGGFMGTSYDLSIQQIPNYHSLVCKKSDGNYFDFKTIAERKYDIDQWFSIWDKMKKCYITDWDESYENPDVLDGTNWDITLEANLYLKSGERYLHVSQGINAYPIYFKKLLRIFSDLVGERLNFD